MTTLPPAWLVAATGLLAAGTLAMAVAETSLWMHYLIDAGESVSLVGLAFIFGAGLYLYRQGRLLASLPLTLPWLLFPVITQGDQIIDNLSINWMRFITHVLLGLLFGTPVAIAVLAVRYGIAPRAGRPPQRIPRWLAATVPGVGLLAAGRVREGSALLGAALLVLEIWVAVQFLGVLMVVTLILMTWAVVAWGFASGGRGDAVIAAPRRSERRALAMFTAGVVVSLGLFLGYKNRPGAYQGSPAAYMDPAQRDAAFRFTSVAASAAAAPDVAPAADAAAVRSVLNGYARAFDELLAGYYILDRNYNYDFHNRLFLRSTPLLANYRSEGLRRVDAGARLRREADAAFDRVRSALAEHDPLRALLDDVRRLSDYMFTRAPVLGEMSAAFEQTQAGLQHATHLYEGEGKMLSVLFGELLETHSAVLASPSAAPMTAEFAQASRDVHDAYANRIVGF